MFNFFAFMYRMKYIERWSLMRSVERENIMEHSEQVAMIAHAIALIGKKKYNKCYDDNKIAVMALYHEAPEVITGDLPTPIKYFNMEINNAYKDLELIATKKLLSMLPDELVDDYEQILLIDKNSDEYAIVKSADKISAYIKCLTELKAGNSEFKKAKKSIESELKKINLDEVKYFMTNFLSAFEKTLDELE